MKEEVIRDIVQDACRLCNGKLGTSYSLDNIKLAFWTIDNSVEIYEDFTETNDFYSEFKSREGFEYNIAEAFVGKTDCDDPTHVDGILVRTDPPADCDSVTYYQSVLLHELMHIYCTTHEIESAKYANQRFFDLYCDDEMTYIGYTIWREVIAEVVKDMLYSPVRYDLVDIKKSLQNMAKNVNPENPYAGEAFHKYLTAILISRDAHITSSWSELETRLTQLKLPLINAVHHLDNMLEEPFPVDPDDIRELGFIFSFERAKNAISLSERLNLKH